jgi:hypothetical protein
MFHTTPSLPPNVQGVHSYQCWKQYLSNIPHPLKIARESNYLADKRPVFPANSKKNRIRVEDTTSFASNRVSF